MHKPQSRGNPSPPRLLFLLLVEDEEGKRNNKAANYSGGARWIDCCASIGATLISSGETVDFPLPAYVDGIMKLLPDFAPS
jgi:hypothetical protein